MLKETNRRMRTQKQRRNGRMSKRKGQSDRGDDTGGEGKVNNALREGVCKEREEGIKDTSEETREDTTTDDRKQEKERMKERKQTEGWKN